jgi:hypothetical protein
MRGAGGTGGATPRGFRSNPGEEPGGAARATLLEAGAEETLGGPPDAEEEALPDQPEETSLLPKSLLADEG